MATEIEKLMLVRNKVIHGNENFRNLITPDLILATKAISEKLEKLAED
jgi:hypothetical protein